LAAGSLAACGTLIQARPVRLVSNRETAGSHVLAGNKLPV
jgi:hypothetical protein